MSARGIVVAGCAALLALAGCSPDESRPGADGAAPGRAEPHVSMEEHPQAADLEASDAPNPPEGYAPVDIDAERVQLFGIVSESVQRAALTREVRTVGVVSTDETRESHVHVKWDGWIEEFFVSYVGQAVSKGDPLFSVYSPDVVAAQQELLVARSRLDAANAGDRATSRDAALSLVEVARTKLELFDVPRATIAEIEQRGSVSRTVVVRAPRSGTVIEKNALPGMYIEPEMDLYVIADLSRVWVRADLYEYETPAVHVGHTAGFTPVGTGGTAVEISAPVVFIDPSVDPATRTVKMRLEIPNPDGSLRPGAYGTVRLEIPLAETLVVPSDAVLDTGTRQIVFVETGAGRFEPRAVQLGSRAGSRVQVLDGLTEGERVVTRAQFMLDSESRLRAAAAAGNAPAHGGH